VDQIKLKVHCILRRLFQIAEKDVHTYIPLSPNSITWYRPRGSDALQLGR